MAVALTASDEINDVRILPYDPPLIDERGPQVSYVRDGFVRK